MRELRYSNPFGEVVADVGAGEKAVEATARVIETAATLGKKPTSRRWKARVAEAMVDEQIEGVRLDVRLRREELRRARLKNEIAEEELRAKRIQNAQALEALNFQRRQRALVEHFIGLGQLDEADAIAAADSSDASVLIEFAVQPPQLELRYHPDSDTATE